MDEFIKKHNLTDCATDELIKCRNSETLTAQELLGVELSSTYPR